MEVFGYLSQLGRPSPAHETMVKSRQKLAAILAPGCADDDIYVLAANYNDVYLPMKDISGETDDARVLSMDSEDTQDVLADIKEE